MGVTCIYHFHTESIDKIHSVSLEVPYDNNRKKVCWSSHHNNVDGLSSPHVKPDSLYITCCYILF